MKKSLFILSILFFSLLTADVKTIAAGQPLSGVKVAVDAGHGGWDPGAVGPGGLTEQEVNLRVAQALRNCLQEYGGATVKMTRTNNSYVSLSSRATQANSWVRTASSLFPLDPLTRQ